MKHNVLIPEPIAPCGMDLLKAACECRAPWAEGKKPNSAEFTELLASSDGVLVRLFKVRDQDIANAPRLKVISKHGVGVDNIDVAAATAKRIPVLFTPLANANSVAEHTITLMLALARNLFPASVALREDRFRDRDKYVGVELAGKTLGVIGLGRIGRRVAEMAKQGFAMEVHAYDPFVAKSDSSNLFIIEDSLEAVLRTADFLTLHLPLTSETRHLLDAERLRLLKPGCRIINTSRGGVIDETALAQALQEGRIAGAALDVFEAEPLPADHPFLRTPNMLLTPHISASTKEAVERMAREAAQGVLDVLQGRRPQHVMNPEIFR